MPIQRAIHAYTKEKLNCAQSILRAFQQQAKVSEETILAAQNAGRGNAEAGRCGALHAALQLANDEATRNKIRSAFVAKAKVESCHEIRETKSIPCVQCVELAAALLAEHHHTLGN